ncbi:MAG: hypothetical protein P4L69_13750 [Desulfosporosinus sp.]|nr:hypothetical protein [Desulfosporosinus sp.]
MESLKASDILQNIATEPYILFLGQNFDSEKAENQKILNLPWSCIFTSKNDLSLSTVFNNSNRMTRNILEETQLTSNALDKKNLKIVRLFGLEDSERNRSPRTEQTMAFSLLNKIPKLIPNFGYLFIAGFSENDKLSIEKLCDLLDLSRRQSVVIFEFEALKGTEIAEISEQKEFSRLNESISDFFSEYLPDSDDITEEDYYYQTEDPNQIHFYINGKLVLLDKRVLFEVSRFAKLLNIEEVNGTQVPPYLYENYFYTFLKESAYVPQWYGYANGFNLERVFEKKLFTDTVSALENPGNPNQKPLGLFGQSGAGKSIAMGNLAYKVFMQKKFPVIYINNRDIDFSSDQKKQNGDIQTIKSPQYEQLLTLLEELDKLDAGSTLIIWDLSAASIRDREKCTNLFNKIKNRGRNVHLVFTSYDDDLTYDMKQYNGNRKKELPFFRIETNLELQISGDEKIDEVKSFRTILRRKARMSAEDIDYFMQKITNSKDVNRNLMTLLYQIFYEVRTPLENGIQREAIDTIKGVIDLIQREHPETFTKTVIAQAFENIKVNIDRESLRQANEAELKANIDKLLITTAICSKFHLSIPSDLAYRLLPLVDYTVIKYIVKIPFFGFDDLEYGDYCFRIRTKLEAEMLLRAYNVSEKMEIDFIADMIILVRSHDEYNHDAEVKLITDLLYLVGPNNSNKNEKYAEYYPNIINALSKFREESGGNARLTLQEIVYMREHGYRVYSKSEKKELEREAVINTLKEAIRIGELEKSRLGKSGYSVVMYNTITIELTNSRIRLCDILPDGDLTECKRAQDDAMSVISNNPDSSYAYSALLWASQHEYKQLKNEADRVDLLAKVCEIIDRVRSEHPEISSDHFFYDPASKLYEWVNQAKVTEYFDELLERGSTAGIYLKARHQLTTAGIDVYKAKELINETQVDVCQKICSELLENPSYASITAINPGCQELRLRLKWLIYNREPIFCRLEQFTRINEDGWKDLLSICQQFKRMFYDSNQVDYYAAHTALYVLALCYAQLDEFKSCLDIIGIIREKTDNWYFENRIKVRHILCKEQGIPKEYEGEFVESTDPSEEKGYIKIYKIRKAYNKNREGIYYHKYNMKNNTRREKGQFYKDLQLGIGFMGIGTYRGLKLKGGAEHDYD